MGSRFAKLPWPVVWFLISSASLWAANDYYPVLEANGRIFREARVLSRNEASLSIRHRGGLSQVPLHALRPELQERYGYQPEAARDRERALDDLRARQVVESTIRQEMQRKRWAAEKARHRTEQSVGLQQAFARFGEDPVLGKGVDLRPAFRQHSLAVRNQGRRPSCSVHSVVAALEYQYAEHKQVVINVAEDHLFENARKLAVNKNAPLAASSLSEETDSLYYDAGLTLEEVFLAIRTFGLQMDKSAVNALSSEEAAQLSAARFTPYRIPGPDNLSVVKNLLHVLNAGMPVVLAAAWPPDLSLRHTSLLSEQPPQEGAYHAVTVVGYQCPTGEMESVKLIFRNSWGARWGAGGYGFISYNYLLKNLSACYVVELH